MPVDTVWHWYWALLGNSKTTSLHILRGPKNEKGEQTEALIEASGHFPTRVAEIVRQRTTAAISSMAFDGARSNLPVTGLDAQAKVIEQHLSSIPPAPSGIVAPVSHCHLRRFPEISNSTLWAFRADTPR